MDHKILSKNDQKSEYLFAGDDNKKINLLIGVTGSVATIKL